LTSSLINHEQAIPEGATATREVGEHTMNTASNKASGRKISRLF